VILHHPDELQLGHSPRRNVIRKILLPHVHAILIGDAKIDNGSDGSGDGDEISSQNPLCLACDRASGAWDARHVLNGNAVYQLPFGLDEPLLNRRGLANTLAGNWELNLTAVARTGFPVNVLLPSSYTAPDGASGTERPDRLQGISLTPPGGRTVTDWINPAAFTSPAGQFGTAPRNLVRGPGTGNSTLAPTKPLPSPCAAGCNFALNSTTSSITPSWGRRFPPSTRPTQMASAASRRRSTPQSLQ
jgi:hypothetical protein